MYKGSVISFVSLLLFWIVVSGKINPEHIIVGIVVSLFTTWFWKDLETRLPRMLSPKELLLFGRCIVRLVGAVIISNIDVAKTLLFSNPSVTPMFIEMRPGIESNWGRVFLATCITITPGTVTIDVDPETNIFIVHALTIETGAALSNWKLIDEIKNLEQLVKRRTIHHVMDTDRIHASDSVGATKRHHRSHRNR